MIHRALFVLCCTAFIASTAMAQEGSRAADAALEAGIEAAEAEGVLAPGAEPAEGELAPPLEPVYPALFDAARLEATPESAAPLLMAGNEGIAALRSEVMRAAGASGNQRTQIVVDAAEVIQTDFEVLSNDWMKSDVGAEDVKATTAIAGALGRTTQVQFELFLGRQLGQANLVDRMVSEADGRMALAALVSSVVPDVGPAPEPDPEADPFVIQAQLKTHNELVNAASAQRVAAYIEITENRDLGDSTLSDLLAAVRAYHEGRDQARAEAAARPASTGLRPAAPNQN